MMCYLSATVHVWCVFESLGVFPW